MGTRSGQGCHRGQPLRLLFFVIVEEPFEMRVDIWNYYMELFLHFDILI